jgi:hypothetical protein
MLFEPGLIAILGGRVNAVSAEDGLKVGHRQFARQAFGGGGQRGGRSAERRILFRGA